MNDENGNRIANALEHLAIAKAFNFHKPERELDCVEHHDCPVCTMLKIAAKEPT